MDAAVWTNFGVLGAVVAVVVIFVRFLREQSTSQEEFAKAREATLLTIGNDCHQFQRELSEQYRTCIHDLEATVKENTRTLGHVGGVLERAISLVDAE